ncbi:GntR family transcriptional regulator [Marinibaculum pumilum]|uniref:GntR family transcriptional regulator n=1 Tax=Marinibaculum pumilum TaxID=1766165 RepID=A0ABV7L643_9PROT
MKPFAPEPALTERVRDAIVGAIVDGTFQAGERLAQEDLAQRLGVSRQPVSHALNVLKEQGILVELGRKGLTVAPVEPERLCHLYAVRGRLDALAAGLAAARVAAGTAPAGPLAEVEALLVEQSAPRGSGDFAAKVDADVAFHTAIYRLSGNPVIEEVARPHWVHFRRSIQAVLADPGEHPLVWRQHCAIFDAIRAGDAGAAEHLSLDHAETAAERTAARLTKEQKAEPE